MPRLVDVVDLCYHRAESLGRLRSAGSGRSRRSGRLRWHRGEGRRSNGRRHPSGRAPPGLAQLTAEVLHLPHQLIEAPFQVGMRPPSGPPHASRHRRRARALPDDRARGAPGTRSAGAARTIRNAQLQLDPLLVRPSGAGPRRPPGSRSPSPPAVRRLDEDLHLAADSPRLSPPRPAAALGPLGAASASPPLRASSTRPCLFQLPTSTRIERFGPSGRARRGG
jgi:hypothetical protein